MPSMRIRSLYSLALAAAIAGLASLAGFGNFACADTPRDVQIVSTDLRPFSAEQPPDAPGALSEMVQEMQRRVGSSSTIQFLPWSRAQLMAQTQPRTLIYPLTRTQERESQYQWLVKLYEQNFVFIAPRKSGLDLKDVGKLRELRVAVMRGSATAAQLRLLGLRHPLEANTVEDMARMLRSGVCDVLLGSEAIDLRVLDQRGMPASELSVSAPVFTGIIWLGASKDITDQQALAWRQAMLELQSNGSYQRILKKYQLPMPGDSFFKPFSITLTTEEYPPYNMSSPQGQVTGVSTDIVKALLAEAGFHYQLAVYPWARAIAMARTDPDTCVFSMSRTPEREALYQWVGPLVQNDWALFALPDAPVPAQLPDVVKATIGSYQGDAIVPYLQGRGYMVDVAPSDDVNPQKLLHGRIDFWATGKLIGQYRLQQQHIDNIKPVLIFNRTEMYLACQRDMPQNLINQLNDTLAAMDKRGVISTIYSRYGYTR
ncbi:MAG: transporter substrate-binding domain-containing protein [Burkholderiaceae bacterium]|nr:transporter substrate-binding domain-containing protein [Roseateles sp.]MBV8470845.1 transporter substrate-binding domain-containing protein [Burkholderiaceae bacterium]